MEQSYVGSFSEINDTQQQSDSYLAEVDRQLVVEVKQKTKAQIDAENVLNAKKSEQEQFKHSKTLYNSLVKSRRNEKSLLKKSNPLLADQKEVIMTTKTNFIPELQDINTAEQSESCSWKVPLDLDAIETSTLSLIERARLFVKLRFGQLETNK